MSFIVRVGKHDYIAEGNTYIVDGEPYVPLTNRSWEAKEYKTHSGALKAAMRKGANMDEDKCIIKVDERDMYTEYTMLSKDGWY